MTKTIWNKPGELIAGSSEVFTVEERIYNIATFISLLVSLISILINVQLGMSTTLNVIIGIGTVSLVYLYLSSRVLKKTYFWFYILIALLILSAAWFLNEGPQGSINYIYILAFVIFLSISDRKRHFLISLILFFNIAILYIIYYYKPELIRPYGSFKTKESDLLFTYSYVIIFSALIFSSLRRNYENEKNKVQEQKEKIENQHKHITDSIFYAKEIQSGLIQDIYDLKNFFQEFFVVWYPKDIVSGDFYYFKQLPDNPDKVAVIVSDCTGHGVPGALLTMLGISYLNEIILQSKNLRSNQILSQLREKIIDSLNHENQGLRHADGMDMVVCIVDKVQKTIDFAGANRPLILIRHNELIEYKPDRFPVGIELRQKREFSNQIIQIARGDMVYLFTDGYADQFSEHDARKFNMSNFKNLLLKNSDLKMESQGKILNLNFIDWKGVNEQVDDVLVIGFKPIV